MTKKVLSGLKTIGKALTQENPINDGGGLSSLLIPRQINGAGTALVVGGVGAFNLAKEGVKGRNRMKLGRVSYADGPARMTNSYTTGAVQAMKRASGGNYAVFSDMAEEAISSSHLMGKIDDYGATPELISALYNMGGR